ncbi:MAG: hypothetical protein NVSMB43_22400 [Pseudarthrobacter sp.]
MTLSVKDRVYAAVEQISAERRPTVSTVRAAAGVSNADATRYLKEWTEEKQAAGGQVAATPFPLASVKSVGREIENRVTGNDSSLLKDQGLKAESTSAADYGSAERQEAFATSLAGTGANEIQVRGRAAAERSEGTHPCAAVTMGKGAAKSKKTRTGVAMGAERTKSL